MKSVFLSLVLIACSVDSVSAESGSTCPTKRSQNIPDGDRVRIVELGENLVFFRAGLRVNTDGAPNSYHPRGRTLGGALNTICNGIAVYPGAGKYKGQRISSISPGSMPAAERCQTILDIFRASHSAGYAAVPEGRIDWYAIALEQNEKSGRKGKPCVQTDGPYNGFFVAQTALAADPALDECDIGHWVDSTTVPYITLPGGSKIFKDAGADPSDLALVHRKVNGQDVWVVAVVADTGNSKELGEGSIALHHALGHPTPAGRPHPGNLEDGVTTFVFPSKRAATPISASSLGQPQVRQTLFELAGGEDSLLDCVN